MPKWLFFLQVLDIFRSQHPWPGDLEAVGKMNGFAEFLLVARYVMSMTMFVFGYSEQLLWTCQSLIELLVENKSHVLSCPINFGLLGKWWVPTITAFEKDQGFCQHQDNNIRMIFAHFSWWMLFVSCIVGCCFAGCCCVLTTISPLGCLNPPCFFL